MIIKENMEFWKNYQEQAWSTCLPSCQNKYYLNWGMLSEFGELVGKLAKHVRGDFEGVAPDVFKEALIGEVGDLLWFLAGNTTLARASMPIDPRPKEVKDYDKGVLFSIVRQLRMHLDIFLDEAAIALCKNEIFRADGVVPQLLSEITSMFGFTLEEAAMYNLEKLAKRYQTNKIIGSGDYR